MRFVALDAFVAAMSANATRVVTTFGACSFWRWDDGLAGNCVWGPILTHDVPPFLASFDALLATGVAFDYLADNRRMRLGDHDSESFGAVFDALQARAATRSANRIRRIASVPPDNAVGVAIVGATNVVAAGAEVGVFASLPPALAWLGHPDAGDLAAWLDAVPELARARTSTVTDRVRAALAADPTLAPEAIARTLGTSTRTLQRTLARAGTTLAAEQLRARVLHAATQLAQPDAKVDAVARAVGFRSTSHFIRAYRELMGETPGQTRARRP